jgi:hypothetical protein
MGSTSRVHLDLRLPSLLKNKTTMEIFLSPAPEFLAPAVLKPAPQCPPVVIDADLENSNFEVDGESDNHDESDLGSNFDKEEVSLSNKEVCTL